MFGIDDALIAGGISAIGGLISNAENRSAAHSAQDFSAEQFATRYQTTVKDLEAAGLSPTLAYSQGGGSPPTGVSYQAQNPFAGAPSAYAQVAQTPSQIDQQYGSASASRASAAASVADTDRIKATTRKIDQEISNLKTDNDRVFALIDNLREERQNLVKTGWNLTEVGNQLRAQVKNLEAQSHNFAQLTATGAFQSILLDYQGELAKMDVQAAHDLGNIGREYNQVKPILDLLRSFIRK